MLILSIIISTLFVLAVICYRKIRKRLLQEKEEKRILQEKEEKARYKKNFRELYV